MNNLRQKILDLVKEFHNEKQNASFVPGKSPIPVSGKVYNETDLCHLVDASLDFWLTTGRYNDSFEKKMREYFGVRAAYTVNSGSSANLVATSALTSHLLEDRALKPGDEIITVAAGFPTTVNPIIQIGCIPVFVDVDIPTYNVNVSELENAITNKTKAIILAHTLGNPFNLSAITKLAKKYNLWIMEDCCDALGSTYEGKKVGTFGDVSTLSFYPAHHMTMGEGGLVFTDDPKLKKAALAIRDWGRDCWCAPGEDNSCKKRFDWKLGELPQGYDHKYTYSHLGYNLKITDMQAAVGVAQFEHLPGFIEKRKDNFKFLKESLLQFEDYFILPEATPQSEPSWFGFPISLREGVKFSREDLLIYLNSHKVATRLLFAGNIVKQPYMQKQNFEIRSELKNTDYIMNNTFWIGVFPGLDAKMLEYVVSIFDKFLQSKK
ncbi:MAG: lipopolysaccharide biosynthesis protein RfbH [Halobacteriovoraceae bacterium]|nr:lipopolysaccharide biosynthesis protein RfbH [Halobacteriovoraceae bacterium]